MTSNSQAPSAVLMAVRDLPFKGIHYVRDRLNEQWGRCGAGDTSIFYTAITLAGEYISVALHDGTQDDPDSYLGVRRAIALNIRGDPRNMPKSYDTLTHGGTWAVHKPWIPASRRDIILVDFMAFREGAGVSDVFIADAKKAYKECRSLSTYSPPTAVGIHRRRGAMPVHVLERGRPGSPVAPVVVNNYWSPVSDLEEVPEERIAELLTQLQTA